MFCNQCGQAVNDADRFCRKCGGRIGVSLSGQSESAAADPKETVLQAIEHTLVTKPGLVARRGQKTDLEISSVLADANWHVGKKKVEYSACLLADSSSRTIVYWEMIKEVGSGIGALFSFKTETYRSDGKTISGTARETGYGFGDKVIDYEWDYSQVRHMVEAIARANGWQFKTVLLKGKAMY